MHIQPNNARARAMASRILPMAPICTVDQDAAAQAKRRASTYERLYFASTAAHAETVAKLAEMTAERDRLLAAKGAA